MGGDPTFTSVPGRDLDLDADRDLDRDLDPTSTSTPTSTSFRIPVRSVRAA